MIDGVPNPEIKATGDKDKTKEEKKKDKEDAPLE
jgi:hypothetical protein